MLRFEERWLTGILDAMLPREGGRPGMQDVDTTGFLAEFDAAAPPLLRLAVRGGVWLIQLSPPVLIGRLRPFSRLTPDDRDEVLHRAAAHRWYVVRQVATVLKLVACFAYFRDPDARRAVEGVK